MHIYSHYKFEENSFPLDYNTSNSEIDCHLFDFQKIDVDFLNYDSIIKFIKNKLWNFNILEVTHQKPIVIISSSNNPIAQFTRVFFKSIFQELNIPQKALLYFEVLEQHKEPINIDFLFHQLNHHFPNKKNCYFRIKDKNIVSVKHKSKPIHYNSLKINQDIQFNHSLIATGALNGISPLLIKNLFKKNIIITRKDPGSLLLPSQENLSSKEIIQWGEKHGYIQSNAKITEKRGFEQKIIYNLEKQRYYTFFKNKKASFYTKDLCMPNSFEFLKHLASEHFDNQEKISLIHGAGVNFNQSWNNKNWEQAKQTFDLKIKAIIELNNFPKFIKSYMFSSTSCQIGNAHQFDYAAANAFVSTFAKMLNNKVTVIEWGPWQLGMVTPLIRKIFKRKNIKMIDPKLGRQCFEFVLSKSKIISENYFCFDANDIESINFSNQ